MEVGSGGFEGSIAAGGGTGGTAPAQTAAIATGAQAFEVAVEGPGGGMDQLAHGGKILSAVQFGDARHSGRAFLRLG